MLSVKKHALIIFALFGFSQLTACSVKVKHDVATPLKNFLDNVAQGTGAIGGSLAELATEMHSAVSQKLGDNQLTSSELSRLISNKQSSSTPVELVHLSGHFYIVPQHDSSQYVEFNADTLELLTGNDAFFMIRDESASVNLNWWFYNDASDQVIQLSLSTDTGQNKVLGALITYY